MTPAESISRCFAKYAAFSGTASRSEYWWFVLFCLVASIAIGFFSDILAAIFNIATIIPSLSVGVRRLHDTDRSGWWLLLWLVPLIGWIVLLVFLVETGRDNRFAALETVG